MYDIEIHDSGTDTSIVGFACGPYAEMPGVPRLLTLQVIHEGETAAEMRLPQDQALELARQILQAFEGHSGQ